MGLPKHLRDDTATLRVVPRERGSRFDDTAPRSLTPTLSLGRKPSSLVLAMAVLVVAGGLLLVRVSHRFEKRSVRTPRIVAAETVDILYTALRMFARDCGRFPTEKEGLIVLVLRPELAGWDGPYITRLAPDPWGNAYVYRVDESGEPRVFCRGPDGILDTEDDIAPLIPKVSLRAFQLPGSKSYVSARAH